MHNYIAHIICCARFTSHRLLAINEMWIGYNKHILINVINVPIQAFSAAMSYWILNKHSFSLLSIFFLLFLYMNVCISYNENDFVCFFLLLVCSIWNYAKRHSLAIKYSRGVLDTILCDNVYQWLAIATDRSVVFSGSSGFLHQ